MQLQPDLRPGHDGRHPRGGALRDVLREGDAKLAKRFFKAAHGPVEHAWKLSTGGDLALPEIEQTAPLPDRVINRYMERLDRDRHP